MENFVKARPKFGFSHFAVSLFLTFARNVFLKLTGNSNFPTVQTLLAGLDTLVNQYADAIDAALNHDKIAVSERNKKRAELEAYLQMLAGIVMGITKDRTILLTSGFEVTSGRGPVEPVGQVTGFTQTYIAGVSGKMKFRWKRTGVEDAGFFRGGAGHRRYQRPVHSLDHRINFPEVFL